MWDEPTHEAFLRRLASFSRLIVFDKRGTGLSDRVSVDRLPTLDDRMDDVRAVMDAAGSERAALFGTSEGGVMSALFAATYPQRTAALILYGAYAKRIRTPDYPWAPTADERERDIEGVERAWGGAAQLDVLAPSMANDPRLQDWWARYLRVSASPGAAVALLKRKTHNDIRPILPTNRVPSPLMYRAGGLDTGAARRRHICPPIPGPEDGAMPGRHHPLFR